MARKRKSVTMFVTVTVPTWMTAAQARREVRYSIKDGVGYLGHGPNFEEIETKVQAVRPAPAPLALDITPGELRELKRDIVALYRACGDEDSEEAQAVADLPHGLNEALADVIRWATV